MRLRFIIVLTLCSLTGQAQKDTVLYFSKLDKVVGSINDAFYYSEIKQGKKGNFILREFALKDNKWTNVYEASIKKETDSSYSAFQIQNKKNIYIRYFTKRDSGFYIRDFFNRILIAEGFSKTLFPLIREGHWNQYSQLNGKIENESEYRDNQLITNKYFLPLGTYINDVFNYVDKNPEYGNSDSELLNFIAEHIKYPERARENNITGKVIVSFVLMADGSIQGLNLLQRVNVLLDIEAIRVVNSIPKDKWKPAEINGIKVNMPVMIPISFSIR
jgi:TonB family protein